MARTRFGTRGDLRRSLGGVLNLLDSGELTEVAAKSRAYICGILAGIIKDSDIEARLTALEKSMQERQP